MNYGLVESSLPPLQRNGELFSYKVIVVASFNPGSPSDYADPGEGVEYDGAEVIKVSQLVKLTESGDIIPITIDSYATDAVREHFSSKVQYSEPFIDYAYNEL